MAFEFKSFQQILGDMITRFKAKSGITDFSVGSVIAIILEAVATEDSQQYFQMLEVIRNYNLDTTEGDDLNQRAIEIMGEENERKSAKKSTGKVSIGDSNFSKISTNIYSGLAGPVQDQTFIYANSSEDFPAFGDIIIGRDTDNVETITYSSITIFSNFVRFNLSSPLANDHGTEETIILSQGGERIIQSGTVVKVPESDQSFEVLYSTDVEAVLLDGENVLENIPITAIEAGSNGNVPARTITDFESEPFDGATALNNRSLTDGLDEETDDELRDRIRSFIKNLSRGTVLSIINSISDVIDSTENKRVVSSNLIDSTDINSIPKLYIDDGTGFEPSQSGIGFEEIIEEAIGGEIFIKLQNTPLVKANVISINSEPYSINNGETLIFEVDGEEETITFTSTDFEVQQSGTAEEIAEAINDRSNLIEARTLEDGGKVVINARSQTNENLQVTGGTANTSDKLNFPTEKQFTLQLYKFSEGELTLLSKDGVTASIENGSPTTPIDSNLFYNFHYQVDGKKVVEIDIRPSPTGDYNGTYVSPNDITLQEIVNAINDTSPGIVASLSSSGTRITITSNTERSSNSKIKIINAVSNNLNDKLNFSIIEKVGRDKDYILNRFNGQIELLEFLKTGDKITAGSLDTRGFLIGNNVETYDMSSSGTMDIELDFQPAQTITFNPADFPTPSVATAEQVVELLNKRIKGIIASKTDDNKIKIQTTYWKEGDGGANTGGSIIITNITGNCTSFGFDLNVRSNSIVPHVPFLVSGSSEPYTFNENEQLVIVLDNNTQNKTFSVRLDLLCEVSIGDAASPYNTLKSFIKDTGLDIGTKFIADEDLVGMRLKFKTGVNVNEEAIIDTYDASANLITVTNGPGAGGGFTNAISVTDEFVLIPKTASNVVTFLNNTSITTFSVEGLASTIKAGTQVQLESLETGSKGIVNVTGGSANSKLNFSTLLVQGLDSYRYYTGLLREVQRTVDGVDTNREEYPGVKAAGVHVDVLAPVIKKIKIDISVELENITINLISNDIKSQISDYINNLKIGEDLIKSQLIDQVYNLPNIKDVVINLPTSNVLISDNELARVIEDNITVNQI